MVNLIEDYKWRYATKRFDDKVVVSQNTIDELKSIINLSPSSFGLQPYRVLVVKDKELREKLRKVSWDQPQITESSHLFIFCSKSDMDETFIDEFIERTSKTRGIPKENLLDYAQMMKNSIASQTKENLFSWMSRQAYIGMGVLLSACATLKIDTCPMEGFDQTEYNKILNLEEKGLKAVAIVAVGYRSTNDTYQHLKKVRIEQSEMFIEI